MSPLALLLESDLSLHLGDVRGPSASAGEATVRVEWAGLSPEDTEALRTGKGVTTFPAVLGREVVGIVEECPGGELTVGSRVVVDPRDGCGQCTTCANATPEPRDHCRETAYLGTERPGGLAESVRVRALRCVLVPDEVDSALACLAWPMAVALRRLEIWSSGIATQDARTVELAGFDAIDALVLVELLRRDPATAVRVHTGSARERAFAQGLGAAVVTMDAPARPSDGAMPASTWPTIEVARDALMRALEVVAGDQGRFQPIVTTALDLGEASEQLAGLLLGGPDGEPAPGKILVQPLGRP